ncbi:DNA cytosine methyltransferase [Actinomadura sp. NPDC023710]|uniref:DNA cytosine methyltransferase n=1 Tax=Actinomadura sp. NPDC023710 TaxID=3158219 RepID=UPI00340BF65C
MTTSPTRPISVIDLFAGCGGLTQGFHEVRIGGVEQPRFRTVGAVEWDVAAASTYAANFADEAGGVDHIFTGEEGNIEHWEPSMLEGVQVDVILGGPPCQGFSGLNRQKEDDPRNQLWRHYMRVVRQLSPMVFVMENVEPFRRKPEFEQLREATYPGGELEDYHLEVLVLNAADYGVPQARKRTIVMATRRDLIGLHPQRIPLMHPVASHRKPIKNESPVLVKADALVDLWVPVSTVFEHTDYRAPNTELPERTCRPLQETLPGTFSTTELHIGRNPTAHSLDRYEAIPPGGNRHDLPPHLSTPSWIRHRTGSADVMGRLRWSEPSVTIRTEFFKPEKGRYLHPYANRPITHYEAALIQGFPPDFKWCGTKVQIARQIGNAVPVGLARAIACQVYTYLNATGQVRQADLGRSA